MFYRNIFLITSHYKPKGLVRKEYITMLSTLCVGLNIQFNVQTVLYTHIYIFFLECQKCINKFHDKNIIIKAEELQHEAFWSTKHFLKIEIFIAAMLLSSIWNGWSRTHVDFRNQRISYKFTVSSKYGRGIQCLSGSLPASVSHNDA